MNRRRGATAMGLFQLLTLLVVAGRLRGRMVIVLPLSHALWWCSRRTVLALTSGGLGGSLSRSWWRCSACDASTRARISMVLVRYWVPVSRRPRSVLDKRSDLWWRTAHAGSIRRERALARWSAQA